MIFSFWDFKDYNDYSDQPLGWLRTAPFINVYMAIAQIAQDPPPLSNGQMWKKSVPNHPGKPLHPRANLCKKNAPNHPSKPLHVPNIEEKGIFLGKGSPFLKCVGSIWALPKSLKSSPPSLSNVQTWKKSVPIWNTFFGIQTILVSPYIPGYTLVKKKYSKPSQQA